jgi:hypothetical protein
MSNYRQNAKCWIAWCVEPEGHDGWHFGAWTYDGQGLNRRAQTAPPNATNDDIVTCHTIELTDEQQRGLQVYGFRRFEVRTPWWVRLLVWLKKLRRATAKDT